MQLDYSIGLFATLTTVLGIAIGLVLFLPLRSGTESAPASSALEQKEAKKISSRDSQYGLKSEANSGFGNAEKAEESADKQPYSAAQDLAAELAKIKAEGKEDSIQAANLYQALGASRVLPDQGEEAISEFEKALQIRQNLAKLDDTDAGNLYFDLARAYQESGEIAKALPLLEKGRALALKLYNNVRILKRSNELDQAEEICRLQKRAVHSTYIAGKIDVLKTLMEINYIRKNYREAEQCARQTLSYAAMHESSIQPPTDFVLAAVILYLARSLTAQQKYEESLIHAREAIRRLSQMSGKSESEYLQLSKALAAENLAKLGREEEYKSIIEELDDSNPELKASVIKQLSKKSKFQKPAK